MRVEQEQTGTFQEGIQLEQGNLEHMPAAVLLEDIIDANFEDGDSIILDGSEIVTPPSQNISFKVRVGRNASDTANIYYINDEPAPRLVLYEGNTYYFDLSDSSLYNADSAKNHQLRFSETSDGTHNSGTAYTTGVTTSSANIASGTAGAYIQIAVASGDRDERTFNATLNVETVGFFRLSADTNVDTTDTINIFNHGFETGHAVVYSNKGGTTLTNLTNNGTFFVIKVNENFIKLANPL